LPPFFNTQIPTEIFDIFVQFALVRAKTPSDPILFFYRPIIVNF